MKLTPKEEAERLCGLFKGFEMTNEKIACKQCALICVDEIIKNIMNMGLAYVDDFKFYQEVKEELLKM